MKRLEIIICLLIVIATMVSCGGNKQEKNESLSAVSEISFEADARYNTNNMQNHTSGGVFAYSPKTDEIIYCKSVFSNDDYECSVVARKEDTERVIIKEAASSVTVFDDKIFYYDGASICSVGLDGNGKKSYCAAQSPLYIYPYGDGVFYREDFKIKYISYDGKVTQISTEQNVLNFSIYNGRLYYGGFEDVPSQYVTLRCYDLAEHTDKTIAGSVEGFEIVNGKIYAVQEENTVVSMGLDGQEKQTIKKEDNSVELYYSKQGLIYVVCQDGECVCKLYNEKEKSISELTKTDFSGALCGDYLCAYSPYSTDGQVYGFAKISK